MTDLFRDTCRHFSGLPQDTEKVLQNFQSRWMKGKKTASNYGYHTELILFIVAPNNKTLVDSIAFGLVNRAAGNHSVSRKRPGNNGTADHSSHSSCFVVAHSSTVPAESSCRVQVPSKNFPDQQPVRAYGMVSFPSRRLYPKHALIRGSSGPRDR